MIRTLRVAILLCFGVIFISLASSQEGKKFSVKAASTPVPKELSAEIAKLLTDSSIQMHDGTGKLICEMWLCKDLATDATEAQLKTGVTYREVKQSAILGAIQFHQKWTDYRKQPVKAGVYTMRLAYQPTDGKHTADVSDYHDFVLVINAKDDKKTDFIEPKTLYDKSGDSLELAHPGVFMMWPNPTPKKEPHIDARPKDHWVVNSQIALTVNGKATGKNIGFGVTLVGHSPVE